MQVAIPRSIRELCIELGNRIMEIYHPYTPRTDERRIDATRNWRIQNYELMQLLHGIVGEALGTNNALDVMHSALRFTSNSLPAKLDRAHPGYIREIIAVGIALNDDRTFRHLLRLLY
jgi:hypothetical protein